MYGSYILYTYTSPRCFAHFAAWRVHQNKRANVAHSLCQPHARTHATPAEFTPLCPRPATHTRTHVHTKCAKTPTPCSIDTRGSTRTTRQSTLANAHARERPRRTRTDRTHTHTLDVFTCGTITRTTHAYANSSGWRRRAGNTPNTHTRNRLTRETLGAHTRTHARTERGATAAAAGERPPLTRSIALGYAHTRTGDETHDGTTASDGDDTLLLLMMMMLLMMCWWLALASV